MSATGLVERTALKEWAVLCDAMARGDIIAMVRKGGIREQRAGFAVRHDRFLLYPTYFHERDGELAPRFRDMLAASHAAKPPPSDGQPVVRLALVADVAAVWHVTDLEPLRGIAAEHGLAWEAVESRYHYRGVPGVHVVAVRASELRRVTDLPEVRRYAGCISWLELDEDVDVRGARPVLDPPSFDERLVRMRTALGAPAEGGD